MFETQRHFGISFLFYRLIYGNLARALPDGHPLKAPWKRILRRIDPWSGLDVKSAVFLTTGEVGPLRDDPGARYEGVGIQQ